MKIEIKGNSAKFVAANGRSLRLHWRESEGIEIISFEISDGRFATSGKLPDVEMSKRETILRHIGNRIERV